MEPQSASDAPARFLYGNVRIRKLREDKAGGILVLSCLYAEREEQTVLYDGVYYSEITPKEIGMRIAMAEELPMAALDSPRISRVKGRMLRCFGQDKGISEEPALRDKHLYVQYGETEDFIIIADSVQVSP